MKAFQLYFLKSGSHLLSHIVSNIVPSAAYVLTIVFGMGTGVSRKRIATRYLLHRLPKRLLASLAPKQHCSPYFFPLDRR